jgi:phosphatidylglycerol lysyltransferase
LFADYNLAGGAHARIRADINHANKAGLSTHEYKPLANRDPAIEQAMADISKSWLAGKHGENLGFTIGSVGLESPMDRRYFYAKDPMSNIVAFHVFIPFGSAGENGVPTGYLADLTHRVQGAAGGVTEKINYDAFMTFRDEGIAWGSLGLAPLANLLEGNTAPDTDTNLLHFFYEHFNRFYEFKSLHLAKARYSPTLWEPGYFVYSTKHLTPQMVYGIIRVQSPGGVGAYLKELFHKN